jgi:3-oxoacyl-[acyl-carrier-protein] synthase II
VNHLPPVNVLGVGAVTALGRDLRLIREELGKPVATTAAVLRVNDDLLADPAIGGRMRRADRFARMAAVAAMDAFAGADVSREGIGLIVTSGFGPHCRGFRFLDGILDCGDSDALPTDFSHSVHGAAAAYITELLGLRGPSLTTTDFEIGFEQAVLLAQCWLEQCVCDRVIVGAVEEIGEVLIHCASRMLKEGRVLGEGAVFMMLGREDEKGIARLEATAAPPPEVDLLLQDKAMNSLRAKDQPVIHARRTGTFSPYFGYSASSSAFQLLGGFLSLGDGFFGAVDKVATFKPSCDSLVSSLVMNKG